jgi:hypothetical protein
MKSSEFNVAVVDKTRFRLIMTMQMVEICSGYGAKFFDRENNPIYKATSFPHWDI